MNEYYQQWKESLSKNLSRDNIFLDILKTFNNKPINILEIGCARSLSGRYGDGWSSLFWADYILNNGGKLDICDIDPDCIENTKILLSGISNKCSIRFIIEDGLNILKDRSNNYDLIYLDGSDDPNDMVNQIKYCDFAKNKILCDDFHTKGSICRNEYPNHILYKLANGHEMAFFDNSNVFKQINI